MFSKFVFELFGEVGGETPTKEGVRLTLNPRMNK